MTLRILQWNMNGFFNNYHELQLLIREYDPDVLCLQETHLKNNSLIINNYDSHQCNSPYPNRAKGGSAIAVKKKFSFSKIQLNSSLTATAIELHLKAKLKIASLYIPPNQSFNSSTYSAGSTNRLPTHPNWRPNCMESALGLELY